jgi:glutamate formiminotransferase/formiminotetrahydrofolate cyclodeaminase
MNLTNINITPLHIAFDETCKKAADRGLRVTGSELVGLIPLKSMLDAGKYFLLKQQRSTGVSEKELIDIAIKSMGLSELSPFKPKERIIEYMLEETSNNKLINKSLGDFADITASESPAPGGGSVSAYLGVLGVSLATMVANLSSHKKGWDERWKEFGDQAELGQQLKDKLLKLVDADTDSFNAIMIAFSLPKSTTEEKTIRSNAIQDATRKAIEIPLEVMKLSLESLSLIKSMANTGNPNSVSDAGVGALCARSAVMGAFLNVKINCASYEDANFVNQIIGEGHQIEDAAIKVEQEILQIVNSKIK